MNDLTALPFTPAPTRDIQAEYRNFLFSCIGASQHNRFMELFGYIPGPNDQAEHLFHFRESNGGVTQFWVYGRHASPDDCARHALERQISETEVEYMDVEPILQFVPNGFDAQGGYFGSKVIEVRRKEAQ